jgi:hypothetical protein
MAPKPKARLSGTTTSKTAPKPVALPSPFKPAPASLAPFTAHLPPGPVYVTHIDPRPAAFKRKLFLVPVALNLAVAGLFLWRMYYILPYYLLLLTSMAGTANETTLRAAELQYGELARVVARRAATFALDFGLAVFVWPWPWEFAVGTTARGTPVAWRAAVGFREKEVYVRRSRESWDAVVRGKAGEGKGKGKGKDVDLFDLEGREAREMVLARVRAATAPMLMQQKTGYLMMDGDWDLDWRGMMDATRLVDKKEVPLEAFGTVALLHHERFGWVTVDLGNGENAGQEERRKQVLMFRDALTSLGKEDLFFRWVEMIQFETSQPGGFTHEKQVVAAQKIRDLFTSNGVDFDALWKETVGTDGLTGMP